MHLTQRQTLWIEAESDPTVFVCKTDNESSQATQGHQKVEGMIRDKIYSTSYTTADHQDCDTPSRRHCEVSLLLQERLVGGARELAIG